MIYPEVIKIPEDMASPMGKVISHANSNAIGIIGSMTNPITKPITVTSTTL